MDWDKGFSASYFARLVDPVTFRSMERIEILEGQIVHSESDLRESADIKCRDYEAGERWIRIYLCARQGGSSETIAMFTGLACSPSDDINGRITDNSVQLYSVLKPAYDVLLEPGWYVPAGYSGAEMVGKLLSVGSAPVIVEEGSPKIAEAIIAEENETRLSMADKVLTAIGWRIRIDGSGTIHVCPEASEPSATFGANLNDVIEPKLKVSRDWYGCPNVFRAISGELMAIAKDESEESPLSIQNRGREIWAQDTSVNLSDGESIGDYASRRLKEEQQYAIAASYDRRYKPNVTVTDIVRLDYPAQGLQGLYKVTAQTITLGYGASTSEEAVKI